MLQAMLHHKLTRQEEQMEDLLTSNVFGLLKYVPQDVALLPWLGMARSETAGDALAKWLDGVVHVSDWLFWPPMEESGCKFCEPDVLLKLKHRDGTQTWLLVEAKYLSGKSSFADEETVGANDQLAREYDNLRVAAARENVARFAVVYLTADAAMPREDIRESSREYMSKRHESPLIFWLSWKMLFDVIEESDNSILLDLRNLLQDLNLVMFRRLRPPNFRTPWSFRRDTHSWRWTLQPAIIWRFADTAAKRARNFPSVTSEVFNFSLNVAPGKIYQWRNI